MLSFFWGSKKEFKIDYSELDIYKKDQISDYVRVKKEDFLQFNYKCTNESLHPVKLRLSIDQKDLPRALKLIQPLMFGKSSPLKVFKFSHMPQSYRLLDIMQKEITHTRDNLSNIKKKIKEKECLLIKQKKVLSNIKTALEEKYGVLSFIDKEISAPDFKEHQFECDNYLYYYDLCEQSKIYLDELKQCYHQLHEKLIDRVECYNDWLRLTQGGQVTIYLPADIKKERYPEFLHFFFQLEDTLNKGNIKSGIIPSSDLSLSSYFSGRVQYTESLEVVSPKDTSRNATNPILAHFKEEFSKRKLDASVDSSSHRILVK